MPNTELLLGLALVDAEIAGRPTDCMASDECACYGDENETGNDVSSIAGQQKNTFKKKHGLCFPTTVDAGSTAKCLLLIEATDRATSSKIRSSAKKRRRRRPSRCRDAATAPNTNLSLHLLWTATVRLARPPQEPVFCMIIMSRASKQPIPLRAGSLAAVGLYASFAGGNEARSTTRLLDQLSGMRSRGTWMVLSEEYV
jgi:hypothetical protein